jgi:hypothetical protein
MKKHGRGILYFVNGSRYVGSFENGNIQGEGRLYQNGVLTHSGRWEMGKLVE